MKITESIGFPYVDDFAKEHQLNAETSQLGAALLLIIIIFTVATIVKKISKYTGLSEEVKQGIGSTADFKIAAAKYADIDLRKGQLAMDFLERLIREKYNYYMYLELLPIYLDRKIPEKNTIKNIKEKIYVSVVGSLTRSVKHEILNFFTEKGIEIFVNEKIIIMMNETDFRSAEKFTEAFREINANNVDRII